MFSHSNITMEIIQTKHLSVGHTTGPPDFAQLLSVYLMHNALEQAKLFQNISVRGLDNGW